jgi:hypothetical protein
MTEVLRRWRGGLVNIRTALFKDTKRAGDRRQSGRPVVDDSGLIIILIPEEEPSASR